MDRKDYLNNQFFSKLSQHNLITSFFINAINDKESHLNYMIFNTENNERLQTFLTELLLEYYRPSYNSKEMMNSLFVLIILEMIHLIQV